MGVWSSGMMLLSKSSDEGSIPSTPANSEDKECEKDMDMISRILEEMSEKCVIHISSPYLEELRSIDGRSLKMLSGGIWTVSVDYHHLDEFGTRIESEFSSQNKSLNAAVMDVYQTYKKFEERNQEHVKKL